MIILTNTTALSLSAGDSVTFDGTILHTGCAECHRTKSSSVKLRNLGLYEVSFTGNIATTGTAGTAQLNVELGGEPLDETTMISETATAGAVNNVSCTTVVKNCCSDYSRLTVVNSGTTAITLDANSAFVIRRIG